MQPTSTQHFRCVVECSGTMRNNDELVYFSCNFISPEDWKNTTIGQKLNNSSFSLSNAYLVFCRPVWQEEIDAGLNIKFRGSVYDEKTPELTHVIDGIQKFLYDVQRLKYLCENRSPTSLLEYLIASNYYDCMSGGMPHSYLVACRIYLKQYKCDLNQPVYPGKDKNYKGEDEFGGWYTLADFMEETKQFEPEEKRLSHYMRLLTTGGSNAREHV